MKTFLKAVAGVLVGFLLLGLFVGDEERPAATAADSQQVVATAIASSPEPPAAPAVLPESPPVLPADQVAFIAAIESAKNAFQTAQNDLAKGGARSARGLAVCKAVSGGAIRQWVGTIEDLSTNRDGLGVLSVQIAEDIYVKTWNNALSDIGSDTLINPQGTLFQSLAAMSEGATVVFSAHLLDGTSSGTDCFLEPSLTLNGSMTSPEYIARFSSVELK